MKATVVSGVSIVFLSVIFSLLLVPGCSNPVENPPPPPVAGTWYGQLAFPPTLEAGMTLIVSWPKDSFRLSLNSLQKPSDTTAIIGGNYELVQDSIVFVPRYGSIRDTTTGIMVPFTLPFTVKAGVRTFISTNNGTTRWIVPLKDLAPFFVLLFKDVKELQALLLLLQNGSIELTKVQ